jgi:hypothetical protein
LIFGCFGIAGALISILLPETISHFLPDDLKESKVIGNKNVKTFWAWWSWKQLKSKSEESMRNIFENVQPQVELNNQQL